MKRAIRVLVILLFCVLVPLSFAAAEKGGNERGKALGHAKKGKALGHAKKGGVPEIDLGMAPSAIAFLGCGVVMLRSRKKK